MEYVSAFLATSFKLFALMTPPAVLSAFLSATRTYDAERKRRTARRTATAVFLIGIVLFFSGETLFSIFGFTLDAFRIGAGALLFLTAVSLMNESPEHPYFSSEAEDIAVVPLGIPLCMGPASIGLVMVWGASAHTPAQKVIGALALLAASGGMYALLRSADSVERMLRRTGLAILAKLTGLLMAAIAAQVVFTGVRSFLMAP